MTEPMKPVAPTRCPHCGMCPDEVPCKNHSDALHGFNRDASHSLGRYVCDCEYWEQPENTATQLAERDRAIVLATLATVDSAILASIGSGSNLQAAIKSIDPEQILKEIKL